MCKISAVNGLPVVIGTVLFLGAGGVHPAKGGDPDLPGYGYFHRPSAGSVWFAPPPSYFGYNLDDRAAGYYGGGRYREYYAYGRGVGLANYPGPLAWRGVPPDYQRFELHDHPVYAHPLPMEALPAAQAGRTNVSLLVQAPADAEIWLDGARTQQTGTARRFESPALKPGSAYTYEIKARWTEQGREMEQSQIVLVHAGDQVSVNFPAFPQNNPSAAPQRFPLAAEKTGQLPPVADRGKIRNSTDR